MTTLPAGWARATLADLAGSTGLVTDGDWIESKDQDPEGQVRLIQLADIGDGDFRDRSSRFVTNATAERLRCTHLEKGDLLIARMPDPLGRACIFPGPAQMAIAAVDVLVWRGPPDGPDARWLMHTINSPKVRDAIAEHAGGTTRQRIAGGRLKLLPLPVPPFPEQRRIVAKIDSLTGKSRRARDHLDHIPRLVEKYKQAVLAAAYSEAVDVSEQLSTLGEIVTELRNGLSKKPTDGPEGTPILRISAVRPLQLRMTEVRYYPPDEVPASALLRRGDLLFTRYNGNPELTAVCAQVRDVAGRLTYPDKLIRVRLNQVAAPSFVELMCASKQARGWLTPHIKSAAGQHGISGGDLKRLPIPLPSRVAQDRIVRRVEHAFSLIGRLASEGAKGGKLIEKLDQAILAKAFRGELLPQDPCDEPASVLLERIGTERNTAPRQRRGRKPRADA